MVIGICGSIGAIIMADRFYFDQTILNRASDMRLDDPWQIGSNKYKPVFIPNWNDKSQIFEKDIPQAVILVK